MYICDELRAHQIGCCLFRLVVVALACVHFVASVLRFNIHITADYRIESIIIVALYIVLH